MPLVANVAWVREQLQRRFRNPGRALVTARNFLDLKEHWAPIVDLIGESARAEGLDCDRRMRASTFTIVGISEDEGRIVAKEGCGPVLLFVMNQGHVHFVPLLRDRTRRA